MRSTDAIRYTGFLGYMLSVESKVLDAVVVIFPFDISEVLGYSMQRSMHFVSDRISNGAARTGTVRNAAARKFRVMSAAAARSAKEE